MDRGIQSENDHLGSEKMMNKETKAEESDIGQVSLISNGVDSILGKGVGSSSAPEAIKGMPAAINQIFHLVEVVKFPKSHHVGIVPRGSIGPAETGIPFVDPSTAAPVETIVSVYRINDLLNCDIHNLIRDYALFYYKLAGCLVRLPDGFAVVVVGGGREAIERFRNLMLKCIKWAAVKSENAKDEDGGDEKTKKEKAVNKCVLLREGIVAKPSFNTFSVYWSKTEAEARRVFFDAGVTEYWDLAVNYSEEE